MEYLIRYSHFIQIDVVLKNHRCATGSIIISPLDRLRNHNLKTLPSLVATGRTLLLCLSTLKLISQPIGYHLRDQCVSMPFHQAHVSYNITFLVSWLFCVHRELCSLGVLKTLFLRSATEEFLPPFCVSPLRYNLAANSVTKYYRLRRYSRNTPQLYLRVLVIFGSGIGGNTRHIFLLLSPIIRRANSL